MPSTTADGKIFAALKRLECSESEVQRYLLQEDDIVINRVNSIEYLGKCAHIKGLLEETVFESNMMRLHLDDIVINAVLYLNAYLNICTNKL